MLLGIQRGYWKVNYEPIFDLPTLTLRGRFLAAEEKVVTPYRFGVYDLLVLPPSFPYGGMVRSTPIFYFLGQFI